MRTTSAVMLLHPTQAHALFVHAVSWRLFLGRMFITSCQPLHRILAPSCLRGRGLRLAVCLLLCAVAAEAQTNRPPVAVDDTYCMSSNSAWTVLGPGVLVNDTDPDQDPLTAILVRGPLHGSLLFPLPSSSFPDGSFSYETFGFLGIDSFTYMASDGALTSNVATVTFLVANETTPLVAYAGPDQTVDAGTLVQLDGSASCDLYGRPLTYHWNQVAGTGVSLNLADPAHPTFTAPSGPQTLTFELHVSAGSSTSALDPVNITVTPGNDPPVARDDTYNVNEDNRLDISAPGVLANDFDREGDFLTAILVSGPTHGTVTLHPDGAFSYTPAANFNGLDSFMYKVSDGVVESNLAVVTLAIGPINDPPVALADGPFLGIEGRSVPMDASASFDVEGAPLTFQWTFGDGSTLITSQAIIEHTYTRAGNFPVSLVVNDGQLDSTPFTTQATIALSGGGQREDVDDFLAYVSPVDPRTDLPTGASWFNVDILYGPTIIPSTFAASLNGVPFAGFSPVPNTSETVVIPLVSGRNTLELQVDGLRSDGRTATDRDRLTFIVP